jgi:hypothetical protein
MNLDRPKPTIPHAHTARSCLCRAEDFFIHAWSTRTPHHTAEENSLVCPRHLASWSLPWQVEGSQSCRLLRRSLGRVPQQRKSNSEICVIIGQNLHHGPWSGSRQFCALGRMRSTWLSWTQWLSLAGFVKYLRCQLDKSRSLTGYLFLLVDVMWVERQPIIRCFSIHY